MIAEIVEKQEHFVTGLSEQDKNKIEAEILLLVDKWIGKGNTVPFSAYQIAPIGDWSQMFLKPLKDLEHNNPKNDASGNFGHLLWNVILKHPRIFFVSESEHNNRIVKSYRLITD
ncbi:MAG: hypothetical protein LBG72_01500 [Spirochaetaceae bacterium]|jgi:hypothetical protein|nr:hypothetical protein [Spirochaetaceae bacterium]